MKILSLEKFFKALKEDSILFYLIVIKNKKHVQRFHYIDQGITFYYSPPPNENKEQYTSEIYQP